MEELEKMFWEDFKAAEAGRYLTDFLENMLSEKLRSAMFYGDYEETYEEFLKNAMHDKRVYNKIFKVYGWRVAHGMR